MTASSIVRSAARVGTVAGLGARPPLDLLPDALLQLARRGGRERDHAELAHRHVPQEADDPLDQLVGLARPRTCDDVQGQAEIRPDAIAGSLVSGDRGLDGELRVGAHDASPRPRSSTKVATAGSSRLASNTRSRSGEQRWSKSQNPHSSNELKNGFSLPG